MDRHDLYQALYYTLAAAPLGDLEPLRERPGESSAAAPGQATVGGAGALNGPRGGAPTATGPGSQNRQRGRNAAVDASPEDLPLEVLLVRTANQMLVEQVRFLLPKSDAATNITQCRTSPS